VNFEAHPQLMGRFCSPVKAPSCRKRCTGGFGLPAGLRDSRIKAGMIKLGEQMAKSTESLIYDMAFRVRLYMASKVSEQKVDDLTDRESLIIELLGMKGSMSISEIGSLYPAVSNSTISTTITKLWKDKKLVDKKILPENQRVTTVTLTEKGKQVLKEIKHTQAEVFSTIAVSLGLSPDQVEYFHDILQNAISFFDRTLGLKLTDEKN
jgi:DNA-binding MarR family transcriptional regulator